MIYLRKPTGSSGVTFRLSATPPHNKDRPPLYGKSLVEADVDVPRVRPDRVRPAVFSPLYL